MSLHDENDLPVLNAVVRAGSEPIIQSSRFGHRVLDQLEAMRRDCASVSAPRVPFPGLGEGSAVHLHAEALEHDPNDDTVEIVHPPMQLAFEQGLEQQPDIALDPVPGNARPAEALDPAIEQLIDDLVDRHVMALRRDLVALLGTHLDRG